MINVSNIRELLNKTSRNFEKGMRRAQPILTALVVAGNQGNPDMPFALVVSIWLASQSYLHANFM